MSTLTMPERSALYAAEEKIEKNLPHVLKADGPRIEVGKALAAISKGKLYKNGGEYKTFEAYVETKWDISRSYAYRLIDHAKEPILSPRGDKLTEKQARALKRAPEELQGAVLDAVSANGQHPSAAAIEELVDDILDEPDPDEQRRKIEREEKKAMDNAPHVYGLSDEEAERRRMVKNLKAERKRCDRIGPAADEVVEALEKTIKLAEAMPIAA